MASALMITAGLFFFISDPTDGSKLNLPHLPPTWFHHEDRPRRKLRKRSEPHCFYILFRLSLPRQAVFYLFPLLGVLLNLWLDLPVFIFFLIAKAGALSNSLTQPGHNSSALSFEIIPSATARSVIIFSFCGSSWTG